jgi:hypothetical protein
MNRHERQRAAKAQVRTDRTVDTLRTRTRPP